MNTNYTVKDIEQLINFLETFKSSVPPLTIRFAGNLDFISDFAKKLLAKNYVLKATFCTEHIRVKFKTLLNHDNSKVITVCMLSEEGLPPEIFGVSSEGKEIHKAFNDLQVKNADEWHERTLKEFLP